MDENQIFRDALGRFRADKENREHEQKDLRRKAEMEFLDGATNMREYIERHEALRFLVVEPEIPIDEMTMGDYMKMRDKTGPSYAHSEFAELLKEIELKK